MRELRNYLERCLVFQEALPVCDGAGGGGRGGDGGDRCRSWPTPRRGGARSTASRSGYAEALLREHNGKVAAAAAAAGMDRVYLYRILRRHGIKPSG